MSKKSTKKAFFPLIKLFQEIDPDAFGKVRGQLARKLTEKEVSVFQDSKLAPRIRSSLIRRAANDGRLHLKRLHTAWQAKLERFGESDFINTAPTGPGCNWLSVGPRNINGRIKCLAIHPTDGEVLYAGAANGGVWKTTDRGQSWTPKMHDEASLAIGAIGIDPSVPDTIYAGTGEPVYLVSGGGPLPPGSSTLAWYYEGVGVYKSTDGGDTWTLTGDIGNDFIYRIAVDPFDSLNLLCAGYSLTAGDGGLCRSQDGGATWTTVVDGIFTDVLFDPNNSGRAYAGQYNGGVLKSTDSGGTWNSRNTGLTAIGQIGRVSLTLARANSDVLYAKIEDDASGGLLGVYRTSSAAEAPAGWAVVTNPGVDSGFLWWCSYIAADPTDASGNIVYAGGVNVARSGDGGSSWTLVTDAYGGTKPPTHPDQHDLVFDPSDSNTVYIANDGAVFKGQVTGGTPPVTWTKVSTGLAVTQFYDLHTSSASRSMFGGGAQDNGSMISTGGKSWRHVHGGDGGYVAFHPTDPYTVYVQSQSANIRRSTDGANSTTSAKSGISGSGIFPATVLALDPATPLTLFTGTNRVYRTTNGGVGLGAWSAASGIIGTVTEIAIAPSSSAIIYAGTLTGGLYQATDGGATATSFANITPAVAGWPNRWLAGIAVHPTDANTIYVTFLGFNGSAAGASDHVWKGVFNPVPSTWSWTMISAGLPDVPVGAIVMDPATSYLYIATDIGVFRSTDDGATWTPFEAGLPNTPVVDLALDPVRNLLRAATHGRGMYQIDLGGTCPEVDLYLRDNIIDTGETFPSPSGVPDPTQPGVVVRHYKSADIKVDAQPFDPVDALTDGVEFDDPEHPYTGFGVKIEDIAGIDHNQPIRTQTNRVYVQVHNRGWNKADSVTVKLLYADAGAGLPALPTDFWTAFPADTFDQTNWKPIGTTTITDLLPNVPRVLSWNWVPPAATSDHVCLLALVHSTQDSLLPETELNVDNLTRANKRSTHRNIHPVDPPAAGSGPAWTSLNFNNADRENKFFNFRIENITDKRSGLRMILPKIRLQDSLENSIKGFRQVDLRKDQLREIVDAAKQAGTISDYVANLVLGFHDPLILEVEKGSATAELRNVLIAASEKVPAVFTIEVPSDVDKVSTFHFDVTQYDRQRLVGGSEFVLTVTPPSTCADLKRLRVVLERLKILDDKDPCIKGPGEFVFTTEVLINGDPVKGNRLRIPETGVIKVSDKPGRNIVTLEQPIFEGYVDKKDRMRISLLATELDLFTADDETTRYSRAFTGNPNAWIRSYRPDDEPSDSEKMWDWQVWYRIEEMDS
ncbi:MAG: WD40/YVTN/BNR-like repeat-containing protein [bacterium]